MLFVLILLYFDLYGHGKLDLKYVHGRAEKCVGSNKICPNMLHISEAETAKENNRTTSFGEKKFVYLRTHLLRRAIATANKQLLSSSDVE